MTGSAVSSSCVPWQNGGAVGEEVLHPVAVVLLLPGEVRQQPRVVGVAQREQGEPGFHGVPGPDQVVPMPGLLVVSPHGMVRPATIAPG